MIGLLKEMCSQWLNWSLYFSVLFLIGQEPQGLSSTILLGSFWIFVILDPRQGIFLGNYQFLPERWRYIPLLSCHPAILLDMVFPVAPLFSNPSNSEWKYQYKQIHMISEWVIKISRGKETINFPATSYVLNTKCHGRKWYLSGS